MKRVKKEKSYPVIKQIKPFFWKECRFCDREFKRELGYEIEDLTSVNPRAFWSYCCNECAKNVDDVAKLVKSRKLKAPPPGPAGARKL